MALVSRWTLDNTSNDLLGSNNGTQVGTVVYSNSSVVGSHCMKCDGGADYIDLGSFRFYNSTNFSISVWFKTSSDTVNILSDANSSGVTFLRIILASGGKVHYQVINNNSALFTDVTTGAYNDNKWHNLVIIDANGTVTSYIDGTSAEISGSYTRSAITFNSSSIGADRSASPIYFTGYLDDVRYYNHALSSDEVSQIYLDRIPRWQTPISRWELDNDATDLYGLHNGTASNVTYSTDSKSKGLSGSFNGSSSLINCGSWSFASYTNFSISLWIKVSGTSDAFLTCTRPGYDFPRIQFMSDSGGWLNYVVVSDVGAVLYQGGGPLCNNGVWHHITLVDANGTIGCYFDGSISGPSGSYTRANLSNLTSVYMGMMVLSSNHRPFAGLMDDVRFYDVALTADEALALYRSYETPKWDQPLHRWKLDGNTLDSVGNKPLTISYGTITYSKPGIQGAYYAEPVNKGFPIIIYDLITFSISCWFKTGQTIYFAGSSGNSSKVAITAESNVIYYYINRADNTRVFIDSLPFIIDDKWHHLILVDSNGVVTSYLDGKPGAINGSYTRESLSLTYNYSSGSSTIDDYRVYDYALSATDARSLYNSYFTEKAASMMELLG